MAAVLAPDVGTWTIEGVEDVVLTLLGNLLREDPAALRERLLGKGLLMPVDSLDMFDILQEFRDVTGLRIPVRDLGRRTLRSVSAFAEYVVRRQNT
jgi:acyl carrier protein